MAYSVPYAPHQLKALHLTTVPKLFEQYIAQGIKLIPPRFRRLIENVAIVVEEEPSAAVRERQRLKPGDLLLGLYEGIPRTARANYAGVLPDKITIFKRHIEIEATQSGLPVAEVVAETIWHEVAHHFGLNENEVRAKERQRRHEHIAN